MSVEKKILIDAIYRDEIRVVSLDKNKNISSFECETSTHLKGNIYLVSVARIELSLQALFVEYGGDKHGFLPFSEVHHEYFNIADEEKDKIYDNLLEKNIGDGLDDNVKRERSMKFSVGDMIKEEQLLLVQVIKDVRGNKGPMMTTFISLAGQLLVLLPNSIGQDGISRKISDSERRTELRELTASMDISDKNSLIIRTEAKSATDEQIKVDYDNLKMLWSKIQQTASKSQSVPSLIHREGCLIYRVLRDMYEKGVSEVLIDGVETYKYAKKIASDMVCKPVVKKYSGTKSMFIHYNVEEQLANLYKTRVDLQSGGYLVINGTEALVSIDINSGRMTNSRSIEQTAYRTNMEAVEEVARQLRIRNLAGIIVVDFIDMDLQKHRKDVQSALKSAFAKDKAKIQLGNITQFGLVEIARQRQGNSFHESNTTICPHCDGSGDVRSYGATSAAIMRALRNTLRVEDAKVLHVYSTEPVVLYLLNNSRAYLQEMENKEDVKISVLIDQNLRPGEFKLDASGVKSIKSIASKNYDFNMFKKHISSDAYSVSGRRTLISQKGVDINKQYDWLDIWFSNVLSK